MEMTARQPLYPHFDGYEADESSFRERPAHQTSYPHLDGSKADESSFRERPARQPSYSDNEDDKAHETVEADYHDVILDQPLLKKNKDSILGYTLPRHMTIISVFAVVLTMISCGLHWYTCLETLTDADRSSIEYKLHRCIILKQNTFPSQDPSIWTDIPAGLSNLNQDPATPAVYLLLFEREVSSISSCIVELITTCANNFIFGNNKWLFLNGSKSFAAKTEDPAGALIETLSKEMDKHSKVVVVTDIQNMPAKLAHGFHFLIDPDNPKVKDAVFIFTLTTDRLLNASSPYAIAQDELNESWKELDNYILQPLVTRFTVVVLPVNREDGEKSCPLKIGSTVEISIP